MMGARVSALVCLDCRQRVVRVDNAAGIEPAKWEHALAHNLVDHDAKPTWGYADEIKEIS